MVTYSFYGKLNSSTSKVVSIGTVNISLIKWCRSGIKGSKTHDRL